MHIEARVDAYKRTAYLLTETSAFVASHVSVVLANVGSGRNGARLGREVAQT